MTFPKTLIIGLGGLGSDIVVDVFQRFQKHSEHADDVNKVRFIALDTDSNEISYRRTIMNPEDVIQTSATSNVVAGQFLDEIKNISTIENWFPTESSELTLMSINDGAGQIRAISRLAFSHAIHSGKLDRIYKAINELLSLNSGVEGNNIEVHIVSSLAGGTGAGSFLQTAYYVRELLQRTGIPNPKVWGYFLLGDVFLRDPSINLSDPVKTTNILANTYACLKELNGIFEIAEGEKIEFEYGHFSSKPTFISKENSIPFDQCMIYDFENNSGNNLKNVRNYKNQIAEFLYLNAFSPTGSETRTRTINDIFSRMKTGSSARYGSTGISKIIYPIDNLLQYFSARRLADNLQTTWQKIDKDYEKLYEEWRIDTNKGIIKKEPILSEYFISNIDSLALNGLGAEQVVFQNIWMSTKMIDEESQEVVGKKSEYLLHEIVAYLTNLRDRDYDIEVLSKVHHNESFTTKENDEANDRSNIRKIEDQLETLQKEVFAFIDDNKSLAIDEIFTKDINSFGYMMEGARHRINTYLLENKKAMHPLAMRYFFYELIHLLEANLAELKEKNKSALTAISKYKEIYDIKGDSGPDTHIESALDAYNIYRSSDSKLISRLAKITGRSGKLEEFKADYVTKSNRQANLLKTYALEKLEEYVFDGLIMQINKMIAHLEDLFRSIPDVLVSLRNETNSLAAVTSSSSGDPSVVYILAKENHRDYIYNDVIAKRDTIFFPEDMSRIIYEELYQKTCDQLLNPLGYAHRRDDRISKIFTEMVVSRQKLQFAENFKNDFAGYNIIQAMRKHAELDGQDSLSFMQAKCREAEAKATPFGAKYDASASKINSWAFHPECVQYQNLTPEEADLLFNNPGNNQNNANRIISDYFEKNEIIREDTVMVLSIPQNYPKFAPVNEDSKYSITMEGNYYVYYKRRIQEIQQNPKLPSPHLDKRWNNPRFFRDLGVNLDAYEKNILKAYIYGVTNKDITLINNHGSLTWGYIHSGGIEFLKDDTGIPIKNSVNKLILQSLWNNEKMVMDLNNRFTHDVENATELWKHLRMEGGNLLQIDLIKNIRDFNFDQIEAFKGRNILTIFNGYIADTATDSKFINLVTEIIIDIIISIAGNNGVETKEQTLQIVNSMLDNISDNHGPITKDIFVRTMDNKMREKF